MAERPSVLVVGAGISGLTAAYRLQRAGVSVRVLEAEANIYTAAPWLQKLLRDAASAYASDASAVNRYQSTATLLADLRDSLTKINSSSVRVDILDLGLTVEAENFRASVELREQLAKATRHQRIEWLRSAIDAAYGTGAINQRGRTEQQQKASR